MKGHIGATVGVMLLAAGCGGGAPTSAPTRVATPAVTSLAAPSDFPAVETPLSAASNTLRQAWLPYSVTEIPPRTIFDGALQPTVINQTGGQLSAAQANALVIAHLREALLEQWADANKQLGLRLDLFNPALDNGPESLALLHGYAVVAPTCDFVGIQVTVVPITPGIEAYFTSQNATISDTADKDVLVDVIGPDPCVVQATSPGATPQTIATDAGGSVTVYAGHLDDDPVLGPIWYYDAVTGCQSVTAPLSICPAGS